LPDGNLSSGNPALARSWNLIGESAMGVLVGQNKQDCYSLL
jgi:hypothetical protein